MKTRDEVETLKAQWNDDPMWDIEDTEGFEEYRNELIKYRLVMQSKWRREWTAKIRNKAYELDCSYSLAEYMIKLEERIDKYFK